MAVKKEFKYSVSIMQAYNKENLQPSKSKLRRSSVTSSPTSPIEEYKGINK